VEPAFRPVLLLPTVTKARAGHSSVASSVPSARRKPISRSRSLPTPRNISSASPPACATGASRWSFFSPRACCAIRRVFAHCGLTQKSFQNVLPDTDIVKPTASWSAAADRPRTPAERKREMMLPPPSCFSNSSTPSRKKNHRRIRPHAKPATSLVQEEPANMAHSSTCSASAAHRWGRHVSR